MIMWTTCLMVFLSLLIGFDFRRNGLSREETFKFFVSGRDSSGDFVDLAAHKARGAAIGVIESVWLDLWAP